LAGTSKYGVKKSAFVSERAETNEQAGNMMARKPISLLLRHMKRGIIFSTQD